MSIDSNIKNRSIDRKVRVNITFEEEIVEKAKELGFNISKLCENCVKHAIAKM